MYEHLRNTFLSELMCKFNLNEVNYIIAILDKIVLNYDINEKETSLAIIDNEIERIVKLYLASKKLEGIAESTIKNYSNQLKIFFEVVQKTPKEITTNDIRMFLYKYQIQNNISDRTLDKHRERINSFF